MVISSRKDLVLSGFKAIADYKKSEGPGKTSLEFNDLQEKVTRDRRNIFGKKVSKEVMLSVSPEKAAADYLNSIPIYVQRMLICLGPIGVAINAPALVRLGPARPIASDQDLEACAADFANPIDANVA